MASGQQLSRDDLVLCAGTVPGSGFRERVEVASAAGFSGITVRAVDLMRAGNEGLTLPDMAAILGDNGVAVAELDAITCWAPHHFAPGYRGPRQQMPISAVELQWTFLEAAEALAARSVNIVEMGKYTAPPEVLAEAFGTLCDRAAGLGLLVHLEALPWSGIPDVATAARIVRAAGRPNGGILLDTWHHFRAGQRTEVLVPPIVESVVAVQISDAPRRAAADLLHETQHGRLLPGHGDADVAATLRTLRTAGVKAPIEVEVHVR